MQKTATSGKPKDRAAVSKVMTVWCWVSGAQLSIAPEAARPFLDVAGQNLYWLTIIRETKQGAEGRERGTGAPLVNHHERGDLGSGTPARLAAQGFSPFPQDERHNY